MKSTANPPAGREISSRVLTMKFMQRAVTSAPTTPMTPKIPSTRKASAAGLDVDAYGAAADSAPLSAKRRKTVVDQADIDAAHREIESRRVAAFESHMAETGDTHWVLDHESAADRLLPRAWRRKARSDRRDSRLAQFNVMHVGYTDIDHPQDDEIEEEHDLQISSDGRIRTANFQVGRKDGSVKTDDTKKERVKGGHRTGERDSDSDSSSSGDWVPNGATSARRNSGLRGSGQNGKKTRNSGGGEAKKRLPTSISIRGGR